MAENKRVAATAARKSIDEAVQMLTKKLEELRVLEALAIIEDYEYVGSVISDEELGLEKQKFKRKKITAGNMDGFHYRVKCAEVRQEKTEARKNLEVNKEEEGRPRPVVDEEATDDKTEHARVQEAIAIDRDWDYRVRILGRNGGRSDKGENDDDDDNESYDEDMGGGTNVP